MFLIKVVPQHTNMLLINGKIRSVWCDNYRPIKSRTTNGDMSVQKLPKRCN